jgi:type III pantothenate kinase
MLLAVDIGNTKIKAAVFKEATLIDKHTFDKNEAEKYFMFFFKKYPDITNSILSSVGQRDDELLTYLTANSALTVITHGSAFPFANKYATPATLGIDRMVLAAGAVLKNPIKNCLIIDAGTCVTYDFVEAGNNYLGGAISPGLQLRYQALHTFTAKLPLLSPGMPQQYIGNSTAESIHSGVVNGLLHEINGFIGQYREQYQDVIIILTGGDAEFLAKRFKNTIFANSNFLLESLNYLYLYTIKND